MDKEKKARINDHINEAIPEDPTGPTTIAHIPDDDLRDTQNAVSKVHMNLSLGLNDPHTVFQLLKEISEQQLSAPWWAEPCPSLQRSSRECVNLLL